MTHVESNGSRRTSEIRETQPMHKDTPLSLLRELLDNSQAFYSAIELDHQYDGEKWSERAKAVIDEPPAFTREDVETLRGAHLDWDAPYALVKATDDAIFSIADRIEALLPPEEAE